ncbi:zinc finger X-chromosomal protein-like [Cervus canadensis]|uniref:zinc finger X-chromosomal protein-like n=1 Tax=Cervus canadensis TaxID=1574408 RepID=UPI001C9E9F87|nr:zinc finger X-chromosomal protein-like [Cervus canadensis]
MYEDGLELQPQEPNSFFDTTGADATHTDGDQIVVEVQETVFVSDVVDSDITVHNFVPDDPDSVVIQDVIEDVVIEDVRCPDIMEEADVSETVIISEQVLDSDVTEEVSLAHCTVPDDVLASDITSASMSMPEHVLTSESTHVSDIGHVEHVAHDSVVEAEVVTDPLTADVVSEEVLVADCASEAVIDANGIPADQQEDDKGNCEDYLMISLDDAGKREHDGSSGITVDAESEIDPCKVDGTCPEVIKVYIFKADPGEDDLGHVTMKVFIRAFASLALLSEEQWLGSITVELNCVLAQGEPLPPLLTPSTVSQNEGSLHFGHVSHVSKKTATDDSGRGPAPPKESAGALILDLPAS